MGGLLLSSYLCNSSIVGDAMETEENSLEELEKSADWVRQEVDRIRASRGLPPLGKPWQKPRCPCCGGSGFIPLGTDIDGYHWSRRCGVCNPDPPQGDADQVS